MTIFYVDATGNYIGGFSEGNPSVPPNAIEVPSAPACSSEIWSGSAWTSPHPLLKDHLADYRWQKETGGITISGLPIRTDDRSKMLLAAIQQEIATTNDPTHTRQTKTTAGFVSLSDAQLSALYLAVISHVQKCFDCEQSLISSIDSSTLTTTQEVEAAFDAAYAAA